MDLSSSAKTKTEYPVVKNQVVGAQLTSWGKKMKKKFLA